MLDKDGKKGQEKPIPGPWRLPTVKELIGLTSYSNPPAWLHTQGFVNVQAVFYWSSTTYDHLTSAAWVVSMVNGDMFYYNNAYHYCVWPVRTGQPNTTLTVRFVDNEDGSITDNSTGLQWKKDACAERLMTYPEAISYLSNLNTT